MPTATRNPLPEAQFLESKGFPVKPLMHGYFSVQLIRNTKRGTPYTVAVTMTADHLRHFAQTQGFSINPAIDDPATPRPPTVDRLLESALQRHQATKQPTLPLSPISRLSR